MYHLKHANGKVSKHRTLDLAKKKARRLARERIVWEEIRIHDLWYGYVNNAHFFTIGNGFMLESIRVVAIP